MPADLGAGRSGVDSSAQSRRHQLSTEADAEEGFPCGQALANARNLLGEEGIFRGIVNANGTAEHHEQIAIGGRCHGKSGGAHINALNRKAAFGQTWQQGAEILKRDVLEYDGM